MTIEIKAPTLPESVQDGTIAKWHKKVGEKIERDELLADIETDKVVLEINASASGIISEIIADVGTVITSQAIIGFISTDISETSTPTEEVTQPPLNPDTPTTPQEPEESESAEMINPAAKKILLDNNIDVSQIIGTGKNGRITKEDVLNYLSQNLTEPQDQHPMARSESVVATSTNTNPAQPRAEATTSISEDQQRVPMTRMRARIAERLLQSTQSTAMLTTFNEVDMSALKNLRTKYKETFEQQHQARLGFMSFFVKACAHGLIKIPLINAFIDDQDIVYNTAQHIGVAVSTDKGLVVPVLRNVQNMNLAGIEQSIANYAQKAKQGKLGLDDLIGGTFTISNGGVFGSLLSTPIINPPQSAILGMHSIQDRPIAMQGEIIIRPMMYLALSYDHRLIDGKDAVQFLIAVKNYLEDPTRMLLEL